MSTARQARLRNGSVLRADDKGKPALLSAQFGHGLQQQGRKHHRAQNGEIGSFRT